MEMHDQIMIIVIALTLSVLVFCLVNFIRLLLISKWKRKVIKRITDSNSPEFLLWKKKVLIIIERMGYDTMYLCLKNLNKQYNKFRSPCDAALDAIEAYHNTLYDESLP